MRRLCFLLSVLGCTAPSAEPSQSVDAGPLSCSDEVGEPWDGWSGMAEPVPADGTPLDEALAEFEPTLRASGLPAMSAADVVDGYREIRLFELEKGRRRQLDPYFFAERLPPNWQFELTSLDDGVRVDLSGSFEGGHGYGLPLVDRNGLISSSHSTDLACESRDYHARDGTPYCAEPFRSPLPPLCSVPFPEAVNVRTREVRLTPPPEFPAAERDHLHVELQVTRQNRGRIAAYFGVGYPSEEVGERLERALGDRSSAWVELVSILPGWVAARAGSYPRFDEQRPDEDDIDVCYGVARELFYPEQQRPPHQSTEAMHELLRDSYCLLPPEVEPRYGDLLSSVGHAGRFVMRDPNTLRPIGISVQSGGGMPYRLWWIDEDFSGEPFARNPHPNVFRDRIDVWRRCKL